MFSLRSLTLAAAVILLPAPARAEDTPVKGKIVGVDLFKNGLAVVRCDVTLARPGTYVLDEVPQPVHGTYWVESDSPVETVIRMRDVEVPAAETAPGNLQEDLAGKKVTLHFKGANRPPVTGTMMKFKSTRPEEPVVPSRFLVVQTGKGRVYIEAAEVASVESDEAGEKVIRQQPRMFLTLDDAAKGETKVSLRYLTHGLSWAPSYRIDITDPKTLALEQHAVIRDEIVKLEGAEVRLISGYPSVQFAHVRSLLSPRTTLAAFFQELGSGEVRYSDAAMNGAITQNTMGNFRAPYVLALGATPSGEGVDLHYQSIGKRTLAQGDTLALTVAKGKADYERIVEWLIADTRDEYGRYDGRGKVDGDDSWDALKFKNPLPFPMTTGPATVTAGGHFNGQRMSYWVNAGEETILRVEKALSIRTRATENESQKEGSARDLVWVGGRQYRKTTVEGEVAVSNHRKEDVSMVIRRRFSGELIQAEGAPKSSLLTEGVYSINRRNELVWTLPLKSGEEVKLKYSYSVLVLN